MQTKLVASITHCYTIELLLTNTVACLPCGCGTGSEIEIGYQINSEVNANHHLSLRAK